MMSGPDNANPTIHKTHTEQASSHLYDFLDNDDEITNALHDDYSWLSRDADADLTYSSGSSSDDMDEDTPGSSRKSDRVEPKVIIGQELIDADEIFDLVRSITDPEHPLTLEQLAVVSAEQIEVVHGDRPKVNLVFTPTIPHCSMATLIGLCIRVRLLRALPDRFKVDIRVKKGSHESENSLNKQLNDKERVAAALENNHLLEVVQNCLATAGQRGKTASPTTGI